jgi:predicted phage tail component-like protein
LTPEYTHKTQDIPGVGVVNFGAEIKEKPFEFEISTKGIDKIDLQHKLRTFISFLFDDFGKPRDIKLIYNYESDKFYTVKVISQIDPDRVLRTGKFDLRFVGYDPYAQSNIFADEVMWGSEVLTFRSYYLLGHSMSRNVVLWGSDELTFDGDYEMGYTDAVGAINVTGQTELDVYVDGLVVKPIIEISGSATNLVISANGKTLNFPTFSNSIWDIDCENYTVLKNGVNTFEIGLREFMLLKGAGKVGISGSGIDIDIRIKYRDKYL